MLFDMVKEVKLFLFLVILHFPNCLGLKKKELPDQQILLISYSVMLLFE